MSQNLQVEVWARDDYSGVFSVEMAVKTMEVDELLKGLEIGKSNGQRFRIRERTTKKTRKKSETLKEYQEERRLENIYRTGKRQ